MMTQNYFGIEDRFPPGAAWYDNTSTCGQLGFIRSSEPAAVFYKRMAPELRNDFNRQAASS